MKVIAVENVSKKFILAHNRPQSVVDLAHGVLRRRRREDFWALKNVSFEIEEGEALGVLGHNGAGKSTILKLLTGIMRPTAGRITTVGRLSALIEVGAGFHPDMTGRENVFLQGSILGMSRTEIERRLDEIIAFSELERFIDTPVKRYSSGMYARLGFSVAAHVHPQILLVDEVLAVGDLPFQLKCLRHMQGLVDSGCSVVLVTHSVQTAKQLCPRLLWIHDGAIRQIGDADSVATQYNNWASAKSFTGGGGAQRWGTGDVSISRVTAEACRIGDGRDFDVDLTLEFESLKPVRDPVIWVMLGNSEGQKIMGATSRRQPGFLPVIEGKHRIRCRLRSVPLMPMVYRVMVGVFDRSLVPLDRWGNCATLIIEPHDAAENLITPDFDGSVNIQSEWDVLCLPDERVDDAMSAL